MPATNVTVISSMEVQLTVNDESGSTKTMTIKEGQKVENLVYTTGGEDVTVTGVVKVIRFNYVNPNVENTCIHDAEPIFPKAVTPTNIVVDCSTEHESDIRVIVIRSIKDMTGSTTTEPEEPDPEPEAPVISNISIVNGNMVYFESDVEVTSATWNGETVTVALVSAPQTTESEVTTMALSTTNYTYRFTAPSVLETNTLVVNGAESAPTEIKPAETPAIKFPSLVNAADKGLSGNTLVCHGIPVTFKKAAVNGMNIATWEKVSDYDTGSQAFATAAMIVGCEIE